ncbi:glycosyltransferase family 4 protein [Pseudalkalibacillus salsuginis]|uniref:glycosyltransferase family 4 protein n=1 Tax=Pseudalkalibacillus salsuginis TaxID=2910972 RepID=UPI001F1D0665|nr:glycosyltransferase family 4 protein [Pseudalkalibacillus salsuginis]MCF6409159.1 glycosyltransferase family 4 protein [Pseudalkalibacillus salsuginis]
MKVLFTYFISSGGVETLNRHRIKALGNVGIECHLLYKERGSGHQNISGIKTFIMSDPLAITALIKREQYDLIVVCTDYQLLQVIRRSGYKGKLVFELQGLGNYRSTERFFIQHNPIINRAADGILLPKTEHLIRLSNNYLSALPRFPIHNCFDNETFHHVKVQKPPSPIIAWVGRIEKNKNWKFFLEIGEKMIERNSTLKLWMFIDDTIFEHSQKQRFLRKKESAKLSNNLVIHNNIKNHLMAKYYSEIADSGGFLCSTSQVEGFGYTIVEAISCGCPILTTDSDGVRNIIENQVSGLFIEQGNVMKAVLQGERLLANSKFRNFLTVNAKYHLKQTFSLERYASEFMNMYTNL